jgi:hypothetical protein
MDRSQSTHAQHERGRLLSLRCSLFFICLALFSALSCFCRVRLYLPGVSSALSSYVSPFPSANKASRFQLFFNRLQQAAQSASNPIEEGAKNLNANFTPLGALRQLTQDAKQNIVQPVYLTRVDTIITTMRESVCT